MTKAEIADVVKGFAVAAVHARQAGCDGVEVHGAQGHLIQAFISPMSNQRDDEYGGSLENRMRFAREIIAAVRDAVGRQVIVGYRMGVAEFWPGGLTVEDAKAVTRALVKLGIVDYFSLAQGNFNTLDTHLPDSHYPAPSFVELHAQVKGEAASIPVIASSRIQTPEQAEAVIAGGKADMVSLCRALIADPEWPVKAREGRSEDIRRCISTSQCWGWIVGTKRLACSLNPTVGYELDLPPLQRAQVSRRVVVVGGGPAGLEAARTAAEQGHRVVLFEKNAALGGKLRGAERFAPYHEAIFAIEYLIRQAHKAGIDMRLGREADARAVLTEKPDLVIIATGATVYKPEIAGDSSVPVFAFGSEFPQDLPSGDIVVMDEDGYYWAASITEALAREGRKVTYVTCYLEPLRELPEVSRISTMRALDKLDVTLLDNRYVEHAERGGLVLRHYYNADRSYRIDGVAALVWIGAQRVNDQLVHDLRARGVDNVRVVGDAHMPRRLAQAIAEGHRAGRAVA